MYNVDRYFDFDYEKKLEIKTKQKKKQQQQGLLALLFLVAGAYYYFMIYLPEEQRKLLESKIQTDLEKVKKLKQDDYDNITTSLTILQEEVNLFPDGDKHPNFRFSRTACYEIYFPPSLKEHYEEGRKNGETNCTMLKGKEELILSDKILAWCKSVVVDPVRGDKETGENNALFYGAPRTGKSATVKNLCFEANKYPLVEIKEKTYGFEREDNGEDFIGDDPKQPNKSRFWRKFITNNPNAIYKEEIETEDENGNKTTETEERTFKSLKQVKTEDVLDASLPEIVNILEYSSNNLSTSLESLCQEIEDLKQQIQLSANSGQITMMQNNINTLFQQNTTTIVATVAAGIVTGGASLVIQAAAIGGAYLVGSAMDADRKQKEQEDKKLTLAGKAGQAITDQVNNLQNDRNKAVQEAEDLIKELQRHKAKLNDPSATSEEKDTAKRMIPIIQSQLDDHSKKVSDYDKKIDDLLKSVPGANNKKGGLVNLESMDQQTNIMDKNQFKQQVLHLLSEYFPKAQRELAEIKKITDPYEQQKKADSAYNEHSYYSNAVNGLIGKYSLSINGTQDYNIVVNELYSLKHEALKKKSQEEEIKSEQEETHQKLDNNSQELKDITNSFPNKTSPKKKKTKKTKEKLNKVKPRSPSCLHPSIACEEGNPYYWFCENCNDDSSYQFLQRLQSDLVEDINADIEEKGLNRLSDIDIRTNPAYSKIFLRKCSSQEEIRENYKNQQLRSQITQLEQNSNKTPAQQSELEAKKKRLAELLKKQDSSNNSVSKNNLNSGEKSPEEKDKELIDN
ncbi:6409_t:CDS:10 [Ambispora gerdemannii]|uniref:6409_t:CDS:1 n=1 Tax=Ambispora gerdemannii TaxID=144530 RepID=A0A9N9CVZ7_9GLOM|nr:6409_t:CDS:10 [Ambispora gerdemannii]